VLAAVATAACSGSKSDALPAPPATMDVTMREYTFDNPATVHSGRIVFTVNNAGTMKHEAILVALPPDAPPIGEQLKSENRMGVATVATLRNRAPGSSGTFAADLPPGRYAFICFVTDPNGVSHALKGMSSEFRVT
jgi:uncharacterized cupredoxin-like copper-binding protein